MSKVNRLIDNSCYDHDSIDHLLRISMITIEDLYYWNNYVPNKDYRLKDLVEQGIKLLPIILANVEHATKLKCNDGDAITEP